MLILNSISGNVHHNDQIKEEIHQAEKQQKLERLFLSRTEMEKSRLRKHTSDGLEIGLSLDPGTIMRDGDVLSNDSKFIMIHQLPEKVLRVKIIDHNDPTLLVQVGHIIGNRHRPISVTDDGSIVFPIHNDDEIDLFKQLFHDIIDHLELQVSEEIFISNEGMNAHEH